MLVRSRGLGEVYKRQQKFADRQPGTAANGEFRVHWWQFTAVIGIATRAAALGHETVQHTMPDQEIIELRPRQRLPVPYTTSTPPTVSSV